MGVSGFEHKILSPAGVFNLELSVLFTALRHIAVVIRPPKRCLILTNSLDSIRAMLSTLLEKVFSFFCSDSGPVPKRVKNITFSSTNPDLFLKKEHFFQINNIFDSKKRTTLAPLRYWT
jgi:hypothetical protein